MTRSRRWCGLLFVVPGIGCVGYPALEAEETSDAADDGGDDSDDDGADESESDTGTVIMCPVPTAGPTEHGGSVAADEVWTADGSPHIVPYDMSVHATVQIEACATVEIEAGRTLSLFGDGRIEALGEEGRPVHIGRREGSGAWTAISGIGGTLHLQHTVVEGGGAPGNSPLNATAAIRMQGTAAMGVSEVLHVEHVVVRGSESSGVSLDAQGAFTAESDDLVVTESASHPLRISAHLMGTIPEGEYTGNAIDEILVPGNAVLDIVTQDMTIRELGVPYHIGDGMSVGELRVGTGQGSLATLTIEPGVVMRFEPEGLLSIEHYAGPETSTGALVAEGTADARIVFTSAAASPAAGDWYGIWFGRTPNGADSIAFADVEFAGRDSGWGSYSCAAEPDDSVNDAAIRVMGVPSTAFVRNTVIRESAGHGIDRGWSGGELDFLESNEFEGVAGCLQTYPSPPGTACPEAPPCP